jgi:signal transduction histidine kinase
MATETSESAGVAGVAGVAGPGDPGGIEAQIAAMHERSLALIERAAAAQTQDPLLAETLEQLSAVQAELFATVEHVQEQQAQLAAAEVRAAALSEYFAVAAHELRTPVTSLRGFMQVLARLYDQGEHNLPRDPQRAHRAVRQLDRQTLRLTQLVEQLLDVSAIEHGGFVLRPEDTDLVELARRVVEALRVTTDEHEIVVRAAGPVRARVDPLRLEQVLANLVGNAIKHTAGGQIVVAVARRDTPEGARVRLSVRDHGEGVAPGERERIFERFHQAHLHRHYVKGLGLGLYISQQIVQRHGGRIGIETPKGAGTRFVVDLPVGDVGEPDEAGAAGSWEKR